MEQAYIDERAIATKLLGDLREAIKGCLPTISSKTGLPPPFDTGVFLVERKGVKLYLLEEGGFVVNEFGTVSMLNHREVVEARWSIREIALALAEEMSANVDGQDRKVRFVERMARKMKAVAELLDPEK
jgi:hypothetical protein